MPIVVIVSGDSSSFADQDLMIFQSMFREKVDKFAGLNECL